MQVRLWVDWLSGNSFELSSTFGIPSESSLKVMYDGMIPID